MRGKELRNLFPGYYLPTDLDFAKVWSEATFVFDTNVLLNLYSYPEDVRNVFLSVLTKLGDRIWVPYHVGLEFHRNRFSRIKQANQRVEKLLQTIGSTGEQLGSEVKSIELEKRNIGISNIQDRLTAVQDAHRALSEAVQLACDKLPPVSLDDSIGERISQLLNGKVGSPPAAQADLDNMLADAQDRFDKKIPPGFSDADKGDEQFRDRGITYFRKFGDLILWRQLINHANQNSIGAIVFVTGDKKKDWWWLDDGKTLGPLPELVQEIKANGVVKLFWMYSADQFLQNAETHLKATEVTAEAVKQVKESLSVLNVEPEWSRSAELRDFLRLRVESTNLEHLTQLLAQSNERQRSESRGLLDYIAPYTAERAVQRWLKASNPGSEVTMSKGFPDFLVDQSGMVRGYEVKQLRNFSPRAFPPTVINSLLRGYLEVNEGRLHDFSLILVLSPEDKGHFLDEEWRDDLERRGLSLIERYPAHSIIFGTIIEDIFEPLFFVGGR